MQQWEITLPSLYITKSLGQFPVSQSESDESIFEESNSDEVLNGKASRICNLKDKKFIKFLENAGELNFTLLENNKGKVLSIEESEKLSENLSPAFNALMYKHRPKGNYYYITNVTKAEECPYSTYVLLFKIRKTTCTIREVVENRSIPKCILLDQPKLSCILIAKGARGKDAEILGALCNRKLKIYLKKVLSKSTLCELCSHSSKEKFQLIIPKQFRSWSKDVFLYEPVAYDPIPESEAANPRGRTGIKGLGDLLYHGKNIMVLYVIARKVGKDTELLSVMDQSNDLKFPKTYLSGYMKKLFDDKMEAVINTTFQNAGYSDEEVTEMIKEIYKSAEAIHVEQKHNPLDTDTSWIETTIVSVWDKERAHIGSIEQFVPVNNLSLTWKTVDEDVMESIKKMNNLKTDEKHFKFKLKTYIRFLPLLCLYGTLFLALLPIAIPFFIASLIAKRFKLTHYFMS
ncbi:hypothetical protein T4B_7761 [Trichinella pseudospiralis]|uniref:Nudix hydrolase 6 n=2 Tax=Trichinella pseudospiralis TaxID=6337 RepID=A0A0V1ETG8_TRIPS|nr:hypothetical protein T4A_13667 [Trichinella pseudospiralis]KRZ34467.1 hypothetical protein T4B_7761 [Trichinella pseudospiralis]